MAGNSVRITKDIDLVYSPDDNGYYLLRYSDNKTSKIYKDQTKCKRDFFEDKIVWEK